MTAARLKAPNCHLLPTKKGRKGLQQLLFTLFFKAVFNSFNELAHWHHSCIT